MAIDAAAAGKPLSGASSSRSSPRGPTSTATAAPLIARRPGALTLGGARLALIVTGFAWVAYLYEQIDRLSRSALTPLTIAEAIIYFLLVTLLTASSGAYLLARIGYFERLKAHRRVPRSALDDYFERKQPTLTVLVPSYREDSRVVRQTLLSAALQEYPNLRIVLLLDDPPNSSDAEQIRALERCRALTGMITDSLSVPHAQFKAALQAFKREQARSPIANRLTLERLADNYDEAVRWLDAHKQTLPRIDHTDDFLATEILDRLAEDLRETASAIRAASEDLDANITRRRVHQLYLRLERIFSAHVTSFERKQYVSLSHEANKAMNLNSYLSLMGGRYRVVESQSGRILVPASGQKADLRIPDSEYVLTLDADSMLLPEYCLRLVHHMEQEENADVAVAQTPYSAYRGVTSRLERVAGATTDIQYLVHQGLTRHNATFWVGANAVIRKRALEELEEKADEGGLLVKRYIKDRTVIEDTESSIDLRARGWRLYNYPERLSYSATPSDFGSLVIQRRRWSNGGLVILPRLLRLLRHRAPGVSRPSLGELYLRTNYLASISWASLCITLLLFYPFDGQLLSQFALLTALPYFWAMANDLQRQGYNRRDVFAVYGFNLLLLPVNLAGTWQSLMQAITGHKSAFARTPKIKDRTVAPLMYVALPLLLIAWSAHTLAQDIRGETYYHGFFAATNLIVMSLTCLLLIGLPGIVFDIWGNIRAFVTPAKRSEPVEAKAPHWAAVLYVGNTLPGEESNGALAAALAAQDRVQAEVRNSRQVAPRERAPRRAATPENRPVRRVRRRAPVSKAGA